MEVREAHIFFLSSTTKTTITTQTILGCRRHAFMMTADDKEVPSPCVIYGGEDEDRREPLLDGSTANKEDAGQIIIRSISFRLGVMNGLLVPFAMLGAHVCYFVRNEDALQSSLGVLTSKTYVATSLILAAVAIIGIPLAFLRMLESLVRASASQHCEKTMKKHLTARFLEGTTVGLLCSWVVEEYVLGHEFLSIFSFAVFVAVLLRCCALSCNDDNNKSSEKDMDLV